MKVIVVSGIFPPRIGGPATQTWHLCRVLPSAGVMPVVVTFAARASREVMDGVLVYRFPLRGRLGGRLTGIGGFCRWFAALLAKERPDVVHCQDTHVRSLLAGWLARRRGVPALVKYAGDLVWEYVNARTLRTHSLEEAYRWGRRARWLARIQRWGLRQFALVQAASEFRQSMLVETVGIQARRVRVIPNFILLPSPSAKAVETHKTVTAISSGRMVRHKRTDWIVRAFASLARPTARLQLVGGDERPEEGIAIQRLVTEMGVADRTTRHGIVPYDRLIELLSASDLFVSGSVEEGFGIAFAEAMACGLPVLAMATTATPEVVPDGQAGFLVPPDDADLLVARWRELVDDDALRRRLGAFARHHARRYDLRENIGTFVSLYSELIRTGPPRSV